jgi:hypothetical protein
VVDLGIARRLVTDLPEQQTEVEVSAGITRSQRDRTAVELLRLGGIAGGLAEDGQVEDGWLVLLVDRQHRPVPSLGILVVPPGLGDETEVVQGEDVLGVAHEGRLVVGTGAVEVTLDVLGEAGFHRPTGRALVLDGRSRRRRSRRRTIVVRRAGSQPDEEGAGQTDRTGAIRSGAETAGRPSRGGGRFTRERRSDHPKSLGRRCCPT